MIRDCELTARQFDHRALQLLSTEPVHPVISDMRMPGMDGTQLPELVRLRWPTVSRMLLTGHADMTSTVAAVNCSEVFRHITESWNEGELLLAARDALERQTLLFGKTPANRQPHAATTG